MTIAATATSLDGDAIGRISDHLGEPDWLRELRAAWWERASATPPPTGLEEEWRRTDLAPLPRDGELLIDAPAVEVSLAARRRRGRCRGHRSADRHPRPR